VKSILNIDTKQKEYHEYLDFQEIFTKIEEGDHYLDEEKPPKCMESKFKTKEFDM